MNIQTSLFRPISATMSLPLDTTRDLEKTIFGQSQLILRLVTAEGRRTALSSQNKGETLY
jgi:hypothetical protein